MQNNRKYDSALVQTIRRKQHMAERDCLQMIMKPIPDDDRQHVLDPRVRETVKRKQKMFRDRADQRHGAFSLSDERFRPDKITYDLTDAEIVQAEQLIDVDGTHKINVFTYRNQNSATEAPVCIFLHGGGFVAGNERLYHNQMRFIAQETGALVVFPEYRLAPEAPFPAAIDDCYATIRWVQDHAVELSIDSKRIMVAGDSAGGALTLSCLLQDQKLEHAIARAYLLFPAVDSSDYRTAGLYDWSWDYYPAVEEDATLVKNRIERIKGSDDRPKTSKDNIWIQGKTSLTDPMVSPVYASDEQLNAFPPLTIAVSEYDFLRIGAEYLASRIMKLGHQLRLVMYCGCDHGFLDLFGTEPQAEEVCLDIADEVLAM